MPNECDTTRVMSRQLWNCSIPLCETTVSWFGARPKVWVHSQMKRRMRLWQIRLHEYNTSSTYIPGRLGDATSYL